LAASLLVSFGPPHHVRLSAATLTPTLARHLDAEVAAKAPATVDEALQVALEATARHLHFGLSHRTSLSFDDAEREGNCIEYAHLFAAAFARASAVAHIDARAFVVHSDDARVLGEKLGIPGYGDHDWNLVVLHGPNGEKRIYVDSTMYDAGLPWDIEGSVRGEVKTP
jgi:hypothetical protein